MAIGQFLAQLAGNAARNYVVGKALGADISGGDAFKMALLEQGLGAVGGGNGLFGFGQAEGAGGGAGQSAADAARSAVAGEASSLVNKGVDRGLAEAVTRNAMTKSAVDPISNPFKQAENTLGYSKFLVDAGILSPDSKLAGLLNSRVGEALATSLAMGLGQELFGSEEEGPPPERPFGGTTRNVALGIRPSFMQAGGTVNGQYFPRRNGGIMPHEGSGQKDDVPAMLMAGEFVLTKDAVKGLGNGDSQKGIERAYSMMNSLEKKANRYV